MYGANVLIDEAITKFAAQPVVFSASDVAAYADVSVGKDATVARALQTQCAGGGILALDGQQCGASFGRRYLGKEPVERWWVASTLRWAKTGVLHLKSPELARAMALSFDTEQWSMPPDRLLAVGRQWGMVDDGYISDTFVFPWATLVHYNPRCREIFRLDSTTSGLPTSEAMVDEVLSGLKNEREVGIIRGRCGLDTGRRATLEQLGIHYGVTRERIRQIEKKAWRKLRHPSRQKSLLLAFAADFAQSGYSLLFSESSLTRHRDFLLKAIGLESANIRELGLVFIGAEGAVASYRNCLRQVDKYQGMQQSLASETLRFLSRRDGELVSKAEQEYRNKRVVRTQPRMLLDALRVLGRAAHFTEIANLCNKMFPDNQSSVHNWHAALGRPDSENLGIVWIGRKGIFGLKEHGYSRPETDLYEATARIVAEQFAITRRPVTEATVVYELGKQRQEIRRGSVNMVLSFSDRIVSVGRGQYIPKSFDEDVSAVIEQPRYNIDAAFAAFLADDDSEG